MYNYLTLSPLKSDLTLVRPNTYLGYYTNSADPVQMPPYLAASDQDLHCLLTEISMENAVRMNKVMANP